MSINLSTVFTQTIFISYKYAANYDLRVFVSSCQVSI